jgi:uncharacterized membrane protein YeaQ/YmgE (transglycosylase-associated protein family)
MSIFMWIIFGAITGWIASMIMGTSEGLIIDIILGVIGASLGGWLMHFFGKSGVSGFNMYSFLVAILGAVVLIALVKSIR